PPVQAGADDVVVQVDVTVVGERERLRPAGEEVVVVKPNVEVFGLERQVVPEGVFEAAADGPTIQGARVGVGAGERKPYGYDHAGLDASSREAAGHVQEGAIPSPADASARGGYPPLADGALEGRNADRSGVERAALLVGPGPV